MHSSLTPPLYPLYEDRWEHDACGTGFLAQVSGEASHRLVQIALEALARLTHRGAQDANAETSDGAGILTQIPVALLQEELQEQSVDISTLAIGMVFLPSQKHAAHAYTKSKEIIEQVLAEVHLPLLRWRIPPIDTTILSERTREAAPSIEQVLVTRPEQLDAAQYEQELYYARRLIERRLRAAQVEDCYIVSFSHRTLIYKGLLAPNELAKFYLDLSNPLYTSAIAVFHQRYSTNTFPAWPLAQPLRLLAHNGEVNTVQGNRNWIAASEGSLTSPLWGERVHDLMPVIQPGTVSDSAQLDNVLELLTCSGRDLLQAMQMLVPPAWEQDDTMDDAQRHWCAYHAGLVEPWDGPAALVFSDGRFVGAALDRNGLRPARYILTAQGLLIVASEAGVVSLDERDVIEKGRLGPGQMIAVDVEKHIVLHDSQIKDALAQKQPYKEWVVSQRLAPLAHDTSLPQEEVLQGDALFSRQQLFGYTHEDVEMILRPMLTENKEPVWSMGDDAPLAALSDHVRSFYDHFHQRFAQVTNPPIDPLRERVVMSLGSYLGYRQSLLTETPLHARLLHINTPLLTEAQLASLRANAHFTTTSLDTTFAVADGPDALEIALDTLQQQAIDAIEQGTTLLVLSDRNASSERAPIPMLIAIGNIHHALIHRGIRAIVTIICETGTAWDIHHIALLLGYGAEAVTPTLALASIRALAGERKLEHLTQDEAVDRYFHVVEDGLRKVMARMGISNIRNIIGAGQFEVVGLDPRFIDRCFVGSAAHPGNISLHTVASQIIAQSQAAQEAQEKIAADTSGRRRKLIDLGRYRFRRDAEYHAFNPLIVRALQKAALSGSREDYQQFTSLVYQRPATALRDLLTFVPMAPIPLEDVEPMESIRARFVVSAMSVGALSPETHRTIAAAMNSIGGRNNTGEGGEDPAWYHETLNGYPVSSKIKQVASARFGVTPEYLVRAEEIEIKMAQGSKPGEGGQLPPFKVTPFIAKLRHTAPGVALISPPPHHDIYSIEDIAQLIYDLHQINPSAKVGVKLVASIGVGTIAAGVAKAHADYVLISGHDGGTGASPLQSIKHAGMPWERGLAEAQQVLVRNGLRKRVKVRVDGGFKTGRDVVVGALLGAEEFAFGTAALVSLGCDMARQCHLNTCPTGIATQREDLRAKFSGQSQHLINYLTLVAEEVREWMARLGVKHFDDLIGHADLLQASAESPVDMTPLLATLPVCSVPGTHVALPASPIAAQLLQESEEALSGRQSVLVQHTIRNGDRSIGAGLAGEIARRHGNAGLPGVSITCNFQGSAGQSFGAFNVSGMRLILNGEANDYVGKSMNGGQIIIAPVSGVSFETNKNTIMGNTVLYGATGGQLFAAGRAGERFAVRNSGALAVVEGVGDHACEYMTGGMVVVLGETGRNFGAGMSSGVAYVYDPLNVLPERYNDDLVDLERIEVDNEREALRAVIALHAKRTRSKHAAALLDSWSHTQHAFWRVQPRGANVSARNFVRVEEQDVVVSAHQ